MADARHAGPERPGRSPEPAAAWTARAGLGLLGTGPLRRVHPVSTSIQDWRRQANRAPRAANRVRHCSWTSWDYESRRPARPAGSRVPVWLRESRHATGVSVPQLPAPARGRCQENYKYQYAARPAALSAPRAGWRLRTAGPKTRQSALARSGAASTGTPQRPSSHDPSHHPLRPVVLDCEARRAAAPGIPGCVVNLGVRSGRREPLAQRIPCGAGLGLGCQVPSSPWSACSGVSSGWTFTILSASP